MNETAPEEFKDGTDLKLHIRNLRIKAAERGQHDWDTAVLAFDRELKRDFEERFTDRSLIQEVDVWQVLVGGSEEEKRRITPQQYNFVFGRVLNFINERSD